MQITVSEAAIQTVTLTLHRFDGWQRRLWVLGQMALARLAFWRMPEPSFWKLCGSGTGEGFGLRPNWGIWAILVVWPDEATARARTASAPVYRRWNARAAEVCTIFLTPVAARGVWSGQQPFAAPPHARTDLSRPLAALTRASLKASHLVKFWRRVPDISATIGSDERVAFKIGIGELPFLHQVTFSIWPDAASMDHFARGDGPHGRAIRAVRAEGWFAEELYARFALLGSTGTWSGRDPLAPLTAPPDPALRTPAA